MERFLFVRGLIATSSMGSADTAYQNIVRWVFMRSTSRVLGRERNCKPERISQDRQSLPPMKIFSASGKQIVRQHVSSLQRHRSLVSQRPQVGVIAGAHPI
jgi:hypothetical protein